MINIINKQKIERMWINQPSTLQSFHKYHGIKVLALDDTEDEVITVYLLEADIISMQIPRSILSKGW